MGTKPRTSLRIVGLIASAAAWVAALALLPSVARAQDDGDPLAEWWFDPSGFASADETGGALLQSALRVALRSGLVPEGEARDITSGALAASVVGGTPHRLVLLEVSEDGASGQVDSFRVALELRTGVGHERIVRTIGTILRDAAEEGAAPLTQRVIDLPGGRTGVAVRRAGWPEWMSVQWASMPGRFVVAVGEDALERMVGAAPQSARGMAHRRAADTRGGEHVLSAYVDVQALRMRVPTMFRGAANELVHALGLGMARDVSIQAWWGERVGDGEDAPRMLIAATAWSSLRERREVVRATDITLREWDAAWGGPSAPPPGRFVMLVPMHTDAWVNGGYRVYGVLTGRARYTPEFDRFARRGAEWGRRYGAAYTQLARAMGPTMMVSDYPPADAPVIGMASVWIPLREIEAGDARTAMRRVMSGFADVVTGGAGEQPWSVRAGAGAPLQVASWSIEPNPVGPGGVLVGGMEPRMGASRSGLIEHLRGWLNEAR